MVNENDEKEILTEEEIKNKIMSIEKQKTKHRISKTTIIQKGMSYFEIMEHEKNKVINSRKRVMSEKYEPFGLTTNLEHHLYLVKEYSKYNIPIDTKDIDLLTELLLKKEKYFVLENIKFVLLQYISSKEYEKALKFINSVLKKYPNSEYAEKLIEFKKKLDEIDLDVKNDESR